jgi:hypothetical protein
MSGQRRARTFSYTHVTYKSQDFGDLARFESYRLSYHVYAPK